MTVPTTWTYQRASVPRMAEALNRDAENLRNRVQCRQLLGYAGWNDDAITKHLTEAMHLARGMRAAEINDWVRKQAK